MVTRLLFLAGLALASMSARAQNEAAEMDRIYAACRASGGQAASNYNDWVAQNGCVCDGVGSGARTCPGTGSSSQSTATSDLAAEGAKATAQGLLHGDPALAGMGILGMMMGLGMQGDPAADAERARQAAAAAEEQERREQANKAQFERQQELTRQRILGALKDTSATAGLALKTDGAATLSVMEVPSDLSTRAVVPIGVGSIPVPHALQLKLGDDADRSSEQARAGFDTAGPMPGALLPQAPAAPPGKPIETRESRIQGFRMALARNEREADALAVRLEVLQAAPVPDPVAITQAQDAVRSKESDEKKILLDLSAEDPDEPGSEEDAVPTATPSTPTPDGASR
jgi:hypothetical protein